MRGQTRRASDLHTDCQAKDKGVPAQTGDSFGCDEGPFFLLSSPLRWEKDLGSGKVVFGEGVFSKMSISRDSRGSRESRESREPPERGKQKRPFSRDSRDVEISKIVMTPPATRPETPFVMTPFSGPDWIATLTKQGMYE